MALRDLGVVPGRAKTIPKAALQLGRAKKTLYAWIRRGQASAFCYMGIMFMDIQEIKRLQGVIQKREEERSGKYLPPFLR